MNFKQTHIPGCFDEMRASGKGLRLYPSQRFKASTAFQYLLGWGLSGDDGGDGWVYGRDDQNGLLI